MKLMFVCIFTKQDITHLNNSHTKNQTKTKKEYQDLSRMKFTLPGTDSELQKIFDDRHSKIIEAFKNL